MTITAVAAKMAAKMAKEGSTAKPVIKTTNTGPELPMAITTQHATIAVYGHGVMSKRDIELASLAFDPMIWDTGADHGVRIIRFLDNGRPLDKDKKMVLANCSPDLGGVLINLQYHFERAVALCVDDPNRSVWFVFNQLLMQSYLHEACHISVRITEEDRKRAETMSTDEEENGAEAWSFESLCRLAKNVNIEPCRFSDNTFFLDKWSQLINSAPTGDTWFTRQQKMLENCISFMLDPGEENGVKHTGLTCHTFRQYIQLLAPDGDTSEDWDKPVVNVPTLNSAINAAIAAHEEKAAPAHAHKEYYVQSGTDTIQPNLENGLFGMPGQEFVADDFGGGYDQFAQANDSSPDFFGGEQMYNNNGFATAEGFAAAAGTDLFPIGSSVGATHPHGAHASGDFAGDNGFGGMNRSTAENGAVVQNLVYPVTGMLPEQTAEIVKAVYMKIYNHIFTNCGRLLNSDTAFQRPEGVCMVPIELSEIEKKVIVKMDCMDKNGQYHRNVPTENGLFGYVSTQAKLPMYKLYINNGGREDVRTVMPQNTNKRDQSGQLTRFAVEARNGAAIMYVIEGDDRKVQAGGKKWLFKINNRNWEAC